MPSCEQLPDIASSAAILFDSGVDMSGGFAVLGLFIFILLSFALWRVLF